MQLCCDTLHYKHRVSLADDGGQVSLADSGRSPSYGHSALQNLAGAVAVMRLWLAAGLASKGPIASYGLDQSRSVWNRRVPPFAPTRGSAPL